MGARVGMQADGNAACCIPKLSLIPRMWGNPRVHIQLISEFWQNYRANSPVYPIPQFPKFPIPVHGETELTERSEIARALQNELGSRYRAWVLPI